jgi:epoxide hydrolase-like predicted phosphatase
MTLRAVFIDLGGVIVRTEYQAPRQHLAERFGMDYESMTNLAFTGDSARKASTGLISEDDHWAGILRRLHLPESELRTVRDEFFAGDIIDLVLLDILRSSHSRFKVGLVSNAFSGLREWIVEKKFADVFDAMIISAEVGVEKPDARIFQIALEKLGVAASESVFLDDFAENIAAARALGMQTIHFTQPEQALEQLEKLLANHR